MADRRDRILLVVPCLNEAQHLPALMPALLGQLDAGDLLVVADGGSTDGSRAIIESLARADPRLHLLANPAKRQSAGVNLAVRAFGADIRWLLRVDAHCGYPVQFIGTLLDAAARERADCVVVPMTTTGTVCFQRAVAAAQNSRLGTGGSAHRHVGEGRWVDHGHHALMDLTAFRHVGGYDESFSHNEDAELDLRLVGYGARLWLEPAAAIIYYPRRSAGSLWRQYLGYGGGRARTQQRHSERMKLRQKLPLMVAPAVLLGITGMLATTFSGHSAWLVLAIPLCIWAAACITTGMLLAIRGRQRCIVLAGPAAMVMHAAWSCGYWRQLLQSRHEPGHNSA